MFYLESFIQNDFNKMNLNEINLNKAEAAYVYRKRTRITVVRKSVC